MAVTENYMGNGNFDRVWRSTRFERKKFARYFLKKLADKDKVAYQRCLDLNEKDGFVMLHDRKQRYKNRPF